MKKNKLFIGTILLSSISSILFLMKNKKGNIRMGHNGNYRHPYNGL